MFFTATFRINEGLNSTEEGLLKDALEFLNYLNYESEMRIKTMVSRCDGTVCPSTLAFTYIFKGLIPRSFVIAGYLPIHRNSQDIPLILCNEIMRSVIRDRYKLSELCTWNANGHHENENQLIIHVLEFPKKNIPKRFICPLSAVIMENPVCLPDGTNVELNAFKLSFANSPVNPFTNLPMKLDEVFPAQALKIDIATFTWIDVLNQDLIERINSTIDVTLPLHRAYLLDEGNPYGDESFRYGMARTNFTMFPVAVVRDRNGIMTDHFEQKNFIIPLNYPHPKHTARALKDACHALLSENADRFQEIAYCYPGQARDYFYFLAAKLNIPFGFYGPPAMQKPYSDDRSEERRVG